MVLDHETLNTKTVTTSSALSQRQQQWQQQQQRQRPWQQKKGWLLCPGDEKDKSGKASRKMNQDKHTLSSCRNPPKVARPFRTPCTERQRLSLIFSRKAGTGRPERKINKKLKSLKSQFKALTTCDLSAAAVVLPRHECSQLSLLFSRPTARGQRGRALTSSFRSAHKCECAFF